MKKILFILISILFISKNGTAQIITDSKFVDSFQIEQPVKNVLTTQLQNQNIVVVEHKQAFIIEPLYLDFTVSIYSTDGTKLNSKTFTINNYGYVADINTMSNGEIVILSVSNNYNTLLFLDTLGNQLRTKSYARNANFAPPHINKLYPTLDNNLIVIAHYLSNSVTEYSNSNDNFSSADVNNTIFKLDNQGNLIWQKQINSYYQDRFTFENNFLPYLFIKIDFLPNANGEFNLIKNTKINNDSVSIELLRIDINGNILWTRTLAKYNKHQFNNSNLQAASYNFLTTKDYIYTLATYTTAAYPITFDYNYSKLNKYDKEGNQLNDTYTENYFLFSVMYDYFQNAMSYNSSYSNPFGVTTNGCNAINNNDLFMISGNNLFYSYYATKFIKNDINTAIPNQEYDISLNAYKINDSTFLYIDYKVLHGNSTEGRLYFNTFKFNKRAISYQVYIDTDNDQQLSANDERPDFIFLESKQNNSSNLNKIENGSALLEFKNNTLISKYSTYMQRNHLYTATPEIDTNYYNPNKTLDTVYFRLSKILNTQDLEVYITPTSPARLGFPSTYRINAENIGSKTISNIQVKFLKDTRQSISNTSEPPFITSNDTLIWNIDSLVSNQSKIFYISCINDTVLTTADTLHLFAAITPFENDTFVLDNTFILNQNVVNSFDPNDKLEAHGAGISPQQFSDGDYLYYTIRFQNTGNSYATKIKIVDTLSAHLDWSTLELLSSSHTFNFNIQNNNILTWSNDNLYLPDSTTDEAGSHGYVSFRIKPKADFSNNDVIQNRAHIYFDFNAPVITNTTSTVILQERITAIKQNIAQKIKLFPSPTNGNVQLQFDITGNKNISLNIIDINGKMLLQKNIQPTIGFNTIDINLSDYANGIYFIQLVSDNEKLYYGKVMKQ